MDDALQQKYNAICFLSVLSAIVLLAAVGAGLVSMGKQVEGLGIAAAVTGLIGVLGTFRPKSAASATDVANAVTAQQPSNQPGAVTIQPPVTVTADAPADTPATEGPAWTQ